LGFATHPPALIGCAFKILFKRVGKVRIPSLRGWGLRVEKRWNLFGWEGMGRKRTVKNGVGQILL
jgi:hypothetical protein